MTKPEEAERERGGGGKRGRERERGGRERGKEVILTNPKGGHGILKYYINITRICTNMYFLVTFNHVFPSLSKQCTYTHTHLSYLKLFYHHHTHLEYNHRTTEKQ